MGLDTIPDRTNGQTIIQSFFNLLKSVLKGDFVPRNTNGIATTDAGSLGTTSYKWLNQYLASTGKVYIGTSEIYLSGDKVMIKDQSGTAYALSDLQTAVGIPALAQDMGIFTGALLSDNETIKVLLQELENQVSGNSGTQVGTTAYTTSSTSYVDIGGQGTLTLATVVGEIISVTCECLLKNNSGGQSCTVTMLGEGSTISAAYPSVTSTSYVAVVFSGTMVARDTSTVIKLQHRASGATAYTDNIVFTYNIVKV